MNRERIENVIVTIVGCAAKAFVIIMAAALALISLAAFCSIFTDAGVIGVFGSVASGFAAWTLGQVSKDIKVFSHER